MTKILLVVGVALTIAACSQSSQNSQSSQASTAPEATGAAQATTAAATAPSGQKTLTVTLAAVGGSKVSGTATFTQPSDSPETRVKIDVTGPGTSGDSVAVQLRAGTCAKLGQPDVSDTWQLTDGKAESPTFTTVDNLRAKPMALVVIPMVGTAGKILSCGESAK